MWTDTSHSEDSCEHRAFGRSRRMSASLPMQAEGHADREGAVQCLKHGRRLKLHPKTLFTSNQACRHVYHLRLGPGEIEQLHPEHSTGRRLGTGGRRSYQQQVLPAQNHVSGHHLGAAAATDCLQMHTSSGSVSSS